MKILLLEDDKYLCGNIKQQLTKEGYIVDACNDGEEGFLLALDQGNSYDLAVIDRMLPYSHLGKNFKIFFYPNICTHCLYRFNI